MKRYISKATSRLYNASLISLMVGFTFIYLYMENKASGYIFFISVPTIIAGIYFLTTAYHRTKKESQR